MGVNFRHLTRRTRAQVDFTFTAEGGDDSPCPLSFRGLDHAVYYRRAGVLNAGHAVVRQYMIDVLRHWALDYGMDGFNFMGAENLVQGAPDHH